MTYCHRMIYRNGVGVELWLILLQPWISQIFGRIVWTWDWFIVRPAPTSTLHHSRMHTYHRYMFRARFVPVITVMEQSMAAQPLWLVLPWNVFALLQTKVFFKCPRSCMLAMAHCACVLARLAPVWGFFWPTVSHWCALLETKIFLTTKWCWIKLLAVLIASGTLHGASEC
jgi:hypothetical protein